jgi:hypothetical protein
MIEAASGNAARLLDLLLAFFADGARWMQGRYHDGNGRHCLAGAVDHLARAHHLPCEEAVFFLKQAMPRRGMGLVYFNDHRCDSIAALRSVICAARALALGEARREREAAAVERWLLAELKKRPPAAQTEMHDEYPSSRAAAGARASDRTTPELAGFVG